MSADGRMTQDYADWKSVYMTPYVDRAQKMLRLLGGKKLKAVAAQDMFGGWTVLAAPDDYEKALLAVA